MLSSRWKLCLRAPPTESAMFRCGSGVCEDLHEMCCEGGGFEIFFSERAVIYIHFSNYEMKGSGRIFCCKLDVMHYSAIFWNYYFVFS